MTQHHDRVLPLRLLVRPEHPAELGRDAEHGEEVGRRDRGAHALRLALSFHAAAGEIEARWVVRRQPGEHAALIAKIGVVGPRVDVRAHPHRPIVHEHHRQALRLRIGERAQNHGVDHGEDRRRGPDPQRQREHGDDRERGCVAQRPGGVAQILNQIGHGFPPMAVLRASVIVRAQRTADTIEIADSRERRATSLVGGQAEREVVADAHLDVEAQLVVDVGVDIGSPESEIAPPARLRHHASRGRTRRTRVTAVANRSQSSASARRCARPARVI